MLAGAANASLMSVAQLISSSFELFLMDKNFSEPAYVARVTALCGFLEGISYLNQDSRSDFAAAFVVDAPEDGQFPEYIQSCFPELPGLTVRPDQSFQGGTRQLEQDLKSLLLVNPFVGDERLARDMRSYLSFKIMDRLDDIINDWERPDDASKFLRYEPIQRFIGTHDDSHGQMIFYLLRSGVVSFVLYFYSSTKCY